MAHDLTLYDFVLPTVDEWLAGDSRTLAFTVTDAAGDPVDISAATVSWALYERAYQDTPADAVLTGDDSGVELVTDNRVDTSAGEFEVRLDSDATADLWGGFYQRPTIEQVGGTVASWRGEVVVTA